MLAEDYSGGNTFLDCRLFDKTQPSLEGLVEYLRYQINNAGPAKLLELKAAELGEQFGEG
ncbi:MAG: hypothetical protein LBT47_13005 [Deltaproteobacteria bacterium]|jgi:hypothetical protein|nr:hypothetical protein [Deltaproteobacteria bacterium]